MPSAAHPGGGGRGAARALVAVVIGAAVLGHSPALGQAPIDADIEVVKTGTPAVARVGEDITFTVVVTNNGPDPVASVQLTDLPPSELSDISWTCLADGGVTCPVAGGSGPDLISLIFAMPPGGTLTVELTGTVASRPIAGRVANQASVDSQDPGFLDTDPSNNFSQAAIPVADLAVVKSADPTDVGPGDVVTYTLAMTNPGGGVYAGAVVEDDLSDVLDVATYNDDATASSGVVSFADPVLTWTGDVLAGGTVTVTYTVTIDDPLGGDGVLTNVVVSDGGNCPEGSTDPDCATEVVPTSTTTTTTTTSTTTTTTTTTTTATMPPPPPTAPATSPPPEPPPTDVGGAATSPGGGTTGTTAAGTTTLPGTGSGSGLLALGFLLAGAGLLAMVHGARRVGDGRARAGQ